MEYLQNWLDATNVPLLTAFILGIMTAISPCPLATNITAIGFISKDMENKKKIFINGLIYTLGRTITYALIGIIIYLIIHYFIDAPTGDERDIKKAGYIVAKPLMIWGERIIGPLLILIGVFMFDFIKLRIPVFSRLMQKMENRKSGSYLSVLLLGIVFALAFCPYSGALYFGLLIPLSVASPSGLFLPVVFAIATGLPVIIVAYLLAFSLSSVGGFYKKVKIFEKWFRRIVALVFIIIGFYYVYMYYIMG